MPGVSRRTLSALVLAGAAASLAAGGIATASARESDPHREAEVRHADTSGTDLRGRDTEREDEAGDIRGPDDEAEHQNGATSSTMATSTTMEDGPDTTVG